MIISPWVFYLISVCNSLDIVCIIMCITSLICAGFCVALIYGEEYCYTTDELKKFKKLFKRFIMLFVICLLGAIFVPSESTATKMLIASQVNETNIERTKEMVDYIVEKIQEVKE